MNRFYPIDFPDRQTVFLLGPRKTGKTTFLKQRFEKSIFIDLLQSDLLRKYSMYPERLRQELLLKKTDQPIVIDEIQLVPALLNEIHGLIETTHLWFVLCGSSARKIRQSGVNLLGGRAWSYRFFPFIFSEIEAFNLETILERGTIPSHLLHKNYKKHLDAYINEYLALEIQQEGLVRNLPTFQRFLEVAAFSLGELVNYSNIARESGVSEKTIKGYFDILEDTLIGHRLYPLHEKRKRDLIFKSHKFYFFDVGLSHALTRNAPISLEHKGHLLESYIFQELNAYRSMNEIPLHFWRTTSGLEIDFILNRSMAIEVKWSSSIHASHLKSLIAFAEEGLSTELIVVCNEPSSRVIEHKGFLIKILNVPDFLEMLWKNEFELSKHVDESKEC